MKTSRLHLLISTALLLCLIAYGFAQTKKCIDAYALNFGMYHDDGIYTVCAKSLAEGRGYRIVSLPNEPEETKYPPFFSIALSPAFSGEAQFPGNAAILEYFSATIGLLFIAAAGALLVVTKRATCLLALAVVAASWLNLDLMSFLPVPMSDLMFGAYSVISIWLCELAVCRRSWRLWLALVACLVAATLTHVTGAILIATCVIFLFVRKRTRAALFIWAVCSAIILPLWYWAGVHSAQSPPIMVYYTNYLMAGKAASEHLTGPFPFAWANLQSGFTDIALSLLPGFKLILATVDPELRHFTKLAILIWLSLLVGIAGELAGRGKAGKRSRLPAMWVALYSLFHLLWPKYAGQRHLLILLPFAYYYIFMGWRALFRQVFPLSAWKTDHDTALPAAWNNRAALRMRVAVGIIFAAIVIGGNAREVYLWAGKYAFRVPPPAKAPADYSEASEFNEAYSWIKANTRPQDVIVWNNDPATYLFTGRKAIMSCLGENWRMIAHPDLFITAEDILESIRFGNGNYLVIDPIFVGGLTGFDQLGAAVSQITKEKPGLLTPVFTSQYGLVTIFKIDQSASQSPAPAGPAKPVP